MSINLSIYSGPYQTKPTVEVVTGETYEGPHHWVSIHYEGAQSGLTFHGRSRAQCERLAAAWLGMWDEPAELTGSPDAGPDAFARGANMQPGLPDRIVRPDDEPHGVLAELDDTTQEWR